MWTQEQPKTSTRPLANGHTATIHRVTDNVIAWYILKPNGARFHSGTTISHRDALGAVAAVAIFNGLMDKDDNDVYMALG